MDGFEEINVGTEEKNEENLEEKFGHFAHDSWVDWDISLEKMGTIKTDLLDGRQEEKLRRMLAKHLRILAISKDELSEARVEPFRIELTDTKPSFEKPMRYNRQLSEFINTEVQALLDKDLIYQVDSAWAAKVILAPKGDSWRMCLNYVGVNAKTKPDRFPLPNIEDIYTWLGGKKVFSKIDLLSGYWQVPVHKDS